MASSVSVVPTTDKVCRPFILEVMVFSPEAGFKFNVDVERSCTDEADSIWKLVFDLYKVDDSGNQTQLVHVSFTTGTPVEAKAVQSMATSGVTQNQADILINDVHPAVKAVSDADTPTPEQKQAIHDAMKKVVNVDVVS